MKFRRCFDLTLPLSADTLRYPGDPAPQIETIASIQSGHPLTVSQFQLNCHVGTHVDAPAHFIADGKRVDELGLEHFHGTAIVVEVGGGVTIETSDLADMPDVDGRHLFLKTGNYTLLRRPDFDPHYRTLSVEAAKALAARNPRSVGFDYYSLDPPSATDFPAHLQLGRFGIPVFLPLLLDDVCPGEYWFVGLPLPLLGVEASPVRAMLFD